MRLQSAQERRHPVSQRRKSTDEKEKLHHQYDCRAGGAAAEHAAFLRRAHGVRPLPVAGISRRERPLRRCAGNAESGRIGHRLGDDFQHVPPGGAGGPLAVYFITIVASECGKIVSKETKVDILVTPAVTILVGVGLSVLCAPAIGAAASSVGDFIKWATTLPCPMSR